MTYIMTPYDESLQYVLKHGVKKSNRTGIDTYSVFGYMTRYDISEYFPLLTKRKMYPKSIFAELLWMLSGSTNVNDLEALGSKIWSPWRSKEFEAKNYYKDGELGPVYGWLMRHFGADYIYRTSAFDQHPRIQHLRGFDQISYLVEELKTNPSSRRIVMNLWDPRVVTTEAVRLPPCHYSFQLSVNENKLSGMLTQRSGDLPIGVCANIPFYSLFIYMLAQQCNLIPDQFIHSVGDLHIYSNQIEKVEEYLSKPETESPKLNLHRAEDIFSYRLEDFELTNYKPLEPIKIPVAV